MVGETGARRERTIQTHKPTSSYGLFSKPDLGDKKKFNFTKVWTFASRGLFISATEMRLLVFF